MSVYDDIEKMCEKIEKNEKNKKNRKLTILYAYGVKAKLKNAEYALSCLNNFSTLSPSHTTTEKSDFKIEEKVHFYVDSFFAFLYSSLDVVAQVINQKMKLRQDEHNVSIKQVKNVLNNNFLGNPIQKNIKNFLSSTAFRNLEKFSGLVPEYPV